MGKLLGNPNVDDVPKSTEGITIELVHPIDNIMAGDVAVIRIIVEGNFQHEGTKV